MLILGGPLDKSLTDDRIGQHSQEPYRELGSNYFDERDRTAVQQRLIGRLHKLGYEVTIQPTALS